MSGFVFWPWGREVLPRFFLLTVPFHHDGGGSQFPTTSFSHGSYWNLSSTIGEGLVPEGHVIHRLAGALNDAFAGRPVQVSSPQGRFAAEAAVLDGEVLRAAHAWGKHLVIDIDRPAEHLIHIHLGLIGKFSLAPHAPVRGQVRLRIGDGATEAELRGPQTCELLGEAAWRRVRERLGADPIRDDADWTVPWRRVRASGRSIAELLMDQSITAGVGNIYRAEVLFRHRIDPATPGRDLRAATFHAIWDDLVVLMRAGVASGRIDTVRPEHTPQAMGRPARVDRHGGEVYVYRRVGQRCLVCDTPIEQRTVAGRHLFWCPRCQRRHH